MNTRKGILGLLLMAMLPLTAQTTERGLRVRPVAVAHSKPSNSLLPPYAAKSLYKPRS